MTEIRRCLRQFNRTYTPADRRAGRVVPRARAARSARPAWSSRSARRARPPATCARRLGLDSGHLARQLRRLEDDGLVLVAPDPGDRRRRTVRLTAKGRALLTAARRPVRAARRAADRAAHRPPAAAADRGARDRRPAGPGRDGRPARACTRPSRRPRRRSSTTSASSTSGSPTASTRGERRASHGAGAGAFVVATSDGEPVACGGIQSLGAEDRARSSGCGCTPAGAAPAWGPGCCATSRRWPRELGHTDGQARHQRHPGRGDRDVRPGGLPPDRPLQRQPLRARPGSRRSSRIVLGVSRSQSSSIGTSRASAHSGSWSRWCGRARVAGGAQRHHPAACASRSARSQT